MLCKYGERCTFAHGDLDMRAKFVPASTLYPTATPGFVQEPATQATQAYSGVDFAAFSPPEQTADVYASYPVQGAVYDNVFQPPGASESDTFGAPIPTPSMATPGVMPGQIQSFPDQSNSNGINGMQFEDAQMVPETSKFGFGFDSLTTSIEELELNSTSATSAESFEKAKQALNDGDENQAEEILKELMQNGEIRYKQLNFEGDNLIMGQNPFLSGF